jgi:hypothetical protein
MDQENENKTKPPVNPLVEEFKKLQESLNPLRSLHEQIAKTPGLPDLRAQNFSLRIPTIHPDQNLASEFHKRLVKWVREFDESLDQEHEVGIRLVSFGQSLTFHLGDIGYWNPSLISFSGFTDGGEPVELIQHVSQISVLLLKVKRKDLSKPKRKIGFAGPLDTDTAETDRPAEGDV